MRPIRQEDGAETGTFEVPVGGRRYRALERLVRQKRMVKTAPVPCIVHDDGLAEEDSLAENVQRVALHPLDQFRAFQALREAGLTEEDIAARFFITPTVVRQRLRLASVSPRLLDLYAEGTLVLEQLMAFAVTPDHDRQEQVWEALSQGSHRPPHLIRRMLTETAVRAGDRRARFVGIEAYEAAGGLALRDLFTEDNGGWLQDVALLERLVAERLTTVAEEVRAEGWRWVPILHRTHRVDNVIGVAHRPDHRIAGSEALMLKASRAKILKRRVIPSMAFVLCFVFFGSQAMAGELSGVVRDNFGLPVEGATVRITGMAFETTTDETGTFELQFVPGAFTLVVTRDGHTSVNRELTLYSDASVPLAPFELLRDPPPGLSVQGATGYLQGQCKVSTRETRNRGFRGIDLEYRANGPPVLVPDGHVNVLLQGDSVTDPLGRGGSILVSEISPNGVFGTATASMGQVRLKGIERIDLDRHSSSFASTEIELGPGTWAIVLAGQTMTGATVPGDSCLIVRVAEDWERDSAADSAGDGTTSEEVGDHELTAGDWIETREARRTLRPGETADDISVAENGSARYRGEMLFAAAPDPAATEVLLFFSPLAGSALVIQKDLDWGGLRAALINLGTQQVLNSDLVPETAVRGKAEASNVRQPLLPIAWSPDGKYAAIPLATGEWQADLLLIDAETGNQVVPRTDDLRPGQWTYPKLETLRWDGDDWASINYDVLACADPDCTAPAIVGSISGGHRVSALLGPARASPEEVSVDASE